MIKSECIKERKTLRKPDITYFFCAHLSSEMNPPWQNNLMQKELVFALKFLHTFNLLPNEFKDR